MINSRETPIALLPLTRSKSDYGLRTTTIAVRRNPVLGTRDVSETRQLIKDAREVTAAIKRDCEPREINLARVAMRAHGQRAEWRGSITRVKPEDTLRGTIGRRRMCHDRGRLQIVSRRLNLPSLSRAAARPKFVVKLREAFRTQFRHEERTVVLAEDKCIGTRSW